MPRSIANFRSRSAAAETRHRLLERIDAVAQSDGGGAALAEPVRAGTQRLSWLAEYAAGAIRQLELERDTVSNNFRTHRKASEEVARRLTDEREALQRALQSTDKGLNCKIAELESALELVARELVSTRTERDGLRANADQVRQLQSQLDEILQRVDREFDDYPLALCRATRAGVITRANRAFGALLFPRRGRKAWLDLASEWFDSSSGCAGG
jgi:chromosome segregation ATPase